MLNFVENEKDPRSGPMNYQEHNLSLSDPDRSLVLSHFLTNFLQNLASCHTAFRLDSFFNDIQIGVRNSVLPTVHGYFFDYYESLNR
jgi:hypothetical protein